MSLDSENIGLATSELPSVVSQPQSSDSESTLSATHLLPLISDFEIVKHVSSGAFGDVFLAKRSGHDDRQLFAVKRVSKKTLITKNLMDQIRCERAALAISRCRYVVHLYYSLQTDSHVYLVMEYLCGGDLRSMLLAVGCLSQEAAVVYTAEVAIALEYLHSHGIIHRDIKPDNMLVSANGHIKLTDFGLSQVNVKRLTQQQLMHGNCTPGGYQASAEKRYPRTPRQLMSLATDFSFGSASEAAAPLSAGGGSCPRSRRRRLYCQRAARFLTPADEEANAATSTIPSPLPAPCFDESPLPQDNGEAKQPPSLFLSNEETDDVADVKSELLEAVNEEMTAEDSEVGEPSMDRAAARVRFKSGASAAAATAAAVAAANSTTEGLMSSDEFCDPLLLPDGQSAQHQHQHHQRLLGTPDYLAPELIRGLPHGTAVDYWALGVCLFEFLSGYPPFSANSPELVMENILNRQIPWPESRSCLDAEDAEPELSPEAISAIDGLLSSDPDSRLDINDLRRHSLFIDVAWQRLHSSEAPFVPDLGGDCQDTSYFEPANRVRANSRRLD